MKQLKILFIIIIMGALVGIVSCRKNKNNEDSSDGLLTEEVEKSDRIPGRDNLRVDDEYIADEGSFNPRNIRWYTYKYMYDAPKEEITAENPVVRSHNQQGNSDEIKEVYDITETSRPPLFNKNCLTAANPELCSNEAVIDWMKYAVERPQIPAHQKEEIIHFVTFIINEKGKVTDARILPASKRETCEPCKAATMEAISGMPEWMPAIRDGRTVKVQVAVPVYYD